LATIMMTNGVVAAALWFGMPAMPEMVGELCSRLE
jgi:hypothetical protein